MSGALPAASERASTVMALGDETILVVEDEAGVRNSAARILGSCGYIVLTAVPTPS
jgi:CheY-like chemotaxis protein